MAIDRDACAERCRNLLDHLDGLCDGRWPLPKRELTPDRLPKQMLPHLYMLDVLPDGDFRFRLFGSHLVATYGREMTGRFLRETKTGEDVAFAHGIYSSAVTGRAPVITRTTATGDLGTIVYDRVICPLADEAGAVLWLLGTAKVISKLPMTKTLIDALPGDVGGTGRR